MTHEFWVGTLVSAFLALSGYLASRVWGYIDQLKSERNEHQSEAIDKLVEETHKNTIAIVELTLQMKFFAEKLVPISKLEKDMNAMHEWRRNLNKLEDPEGETV